MDTALIHDEREGVYGGDGDADGDDGCDGDADDDNKMRLGLLPEAILIKTIVYGFSFFPVVAFCTWCSWSRGCLPEASSGSTYYKDICFWMLPLSAGHICRCGIIWADRMEIYVNIASKV